MLNSKLAFISSLTFMSLSAMAGTLPVSQMVVFGDSLSDDGNAYLVYTYDHADFPAGAPAPIPPNYTTGAYTSGMDTTPASAHFGSVWVQDLAVSMGLPVPAASLGPSFGAPAGPSYTDYAVGSAVTGGPTYSNAYPSMNAQVMQYLGAPHSPAPSALYVLWGGANDLLNVNPASLPGNPLLLQTAATDAITNLAAEITALSAAGGKYFLWADLPPLGSIPATQGNAAYDAALNAASLSFKQEWSAEISQLQQMNPGITIIGLDVYSLFENLIANPGGLDVTGTPQGNSSANPDDYLFWDGLHPTNVGHALIAATALAGIEAIPEPGTGGLLLFGIFGIAGVRSLRRKAGSMR